MPNKPKFRVETVKEALIKANGFISQAAKILQCDRTTVYSYFKRYPELNDVLKEQRETMLDFAESKLMAAISKGNLTAIIFFLKTQGRSRGYYEKIETNTSFSIDRNDIPKDVLDKLTYVEKTSKHTE
ncbi:MAG TPA: hypothetical protein PLV01_07535 [Candidatus Kapabacteria bacterium]|nr:hypothetical protein [Candidatus Kapabacteria bacterium]